MDGRGRLSLHRKPTAVVRPALSLSFPSAFLRGCGFLSFVANEGVIQLG